MNKGDLFAVQPDFWDQLKNADFTGMKAMTTEEEKEARLSAFVSSAAARHMEGTFAMSRVGSTAILPIVGMVRPRQSYSYYDFYGSAATSLSLASRDFGAAMEDSTIETIVLAIDSPGGLVAGVNEFAEQIYAARGSKKVVAFIEHACASAAYWIGAAAEAVHIAPTGLAGSIGVQMQFTDTSAMREAAGVKDITITSGSSPNKNRPLTTPEGVADAQAIVDQQAATFQEAVAKYRGVDLAVVSAEFGQGSLFVGKQAKAAGLADEVSSFHELLGISKPQETGEVLMDTHNDQLAAQVKAAGTGATFIVSAAGDLRVLDLNNVATVKEVAAGVLAELVATARAEGEAAGVENFRTAETARIGAIDEAFDGNELFKPVADELKADSSMDVGKILAECNARMKRGELTAASHDDADGFAGLPMGEPESQRAASGAAENLDRQQAAGFDCDDARLGDNVSKLPNKAMAAGIAEAAAANNKLNGVGE